jgi:hypothetical protein
MQSASKSNGCSSRVERQRNDDDDVDARRANKRTKPNLVNETKKHSSRESTIGDRQWRTAARNAKRNSGELSDSADSYIIGVAQ